MFNGLIKPETLLKYNFMIKFEKIKEKENTFIKKISFLTDNYVKL